MLIKSEKGVTGVDIIISLIIITLFVTLIGNLIINIDMNTKSTKRKSEALSYAVSEIESIKAQGYIDDYNGKGILAEEKIYEENISSYAKEIFIKDYTLIQKENNNEEVYVNNLVKEIRVKISYKLGKDVKEVQLSTIVSK